MAKRTVQGTLQNIRKLRTFFRDEMERRSKQDEIEAITKAIKAELALDEKVLRKERRSLEKEIEGPDHEL